MKQAKPCPFCGCEEIRLGHESAMAFHAVCTGCGARTRPFEIPAEWPENLKPPEECDNWKDAMTPLENHLMELAAQAWNTRC